MSQNGWWGNGGASVPPPAGFPGSEGGQLSPSVTSVETEAQSRSPGSVWQPWALNQRSLNLTGVEVRGLSAPSGPSFYLVL